MIKEAVILAGGLGTRLRDVVEELPKVLAPVGGEPFIKYLFDQLCRFKFSKAVLAVGYKGELIEERFGPRYGNLELVYSVETEPLGTGGAISLAAKKISSDSFLVLNGDTLFDLNIDDFRKTFLYGNGSMSVALKPMMNFSRYGAVQMEGERIVKFSEKEYRESGLINGGVYMIRKEWLLRNSPSRAFSFEKDLMEKKVDYDLVTGYISDGYFIDIGIPEDYEKASLEVPLKFGKKSG